MATATAPAVCISCRVEPALAGSATCAPCARARAERARVFARRDALRDTAEPTATDLAQIESEEESDQGPQPGVNVLKACPSWVMSRVSGAPGPVAGPAMLDGPPAGSVKPGVAHRSPASRRWTCQRCGRVFATASGLGGHRRSIVCYPDRQPGAAGDGDADASPPEPHQRLYELIDLAVGWSCLTEPQRRCAMAIGQLPDDELTLVVGIAGRFADRTTTLFDQLRRGA